MVCRAVYSVVRKLTEVRTMGRGDEWNSSSTVLVPVPISYYDEGEGREDVIPNMKIPPRIPAK